MTFERLICVAAKPCDGCMGGIYPGEEYWSTEDRRVKVCSADCQRVVAIKAVMR